MLELEKERIQLLCNNLNQYSQHISLFGQTLTTVSSRGHSISGVHGKADRKRFFTKPTLLFLVLQCHTQIHCAISKVDIEKDIQALMEETTILSTENKSEFLLTDYFVSTERQEMPLAEHLGCALSHTGTKETGNGVFSHPSPVSLSPKLAFEPLVFLLPPPEGWDYSRVVLPEWNSLPL